MLNCETWPTESPLFSTPTPARRMLSAAATLAGAWIVLDRTDGQGSATAEALLDLALEPYRAPRPTPSRIGPHSARGGEG